jgi:hypothetical protein
MNDHFLDHDSTIFDRSDTAFFHADQTKKAIADLASTNSLVIYCGAGVTIDRTGLTWSKLIAGLLHPDIDKPEERAKYPAPEEIRVLEEKLNPLELASIVHEIRIAGSRSRATSLNALIRRMETLLYTDNGWQRGILARNVIRLAVHSMQLGKKAVIVTSNYDTYLEAEFREYCDKLRKFARKGKKPAPRLPKLVPITLGDTHRVGDREAIEIVYLHGRVPDGGRHTGKLILCERDYHESHELVVNKLCELFDADNTGVLIVGASLTDPPLLAALSKTRKRTGRFAMLPAQSTNLANTSPALFKQLCARLGERGSHFSVRILVPDFYFQVAQFCQEVLTSINLGSAEYSQDPLRYGRRLLTWSSRWETKNSSPSRLRFAYREAVKCLRSVRKAIKEDLDARNDNRELDIAKIELWVRHEPSDTSRQLALWASSAGILYDRELLRKESLGLLSCNASVQALQEGQARLVSSSSLIRGNPGRPETIEAVTRKHKWQTFLSVPIRMEDPAGDIVVGVVTLASQTPLDESMLSHCNTATIESILKLLRSYGTKLFRVE